MTFSPFGEPEPVERRQVQLWSGGWSATKWPCSNTSPNGRRTFRRPNQILKEKIVETRPFGGSPTIPSTSDLLNLTPLDFHLSSFSSPEKRLGLLVPLLDSQSFLFTYWTAQYCSPRASQSTNLGLWHQKLYLWAFGRMNSAQLYKFRNLVA